MEATTPATNVRKPPHAHDAAIGRACSRVAPTWPLDRFIAVNPFWHRTESPLPEVAARMLALGGSRLVMPRAWLREQWRGGAFGREHVRAAIEEARAPRAVEAVLASLHRDEAPPPRRARVTDVADARRDLAHEMPWGEFVVHAVGRHCAAWFDDGQAQLGAPRDGGLYESFRRGAPHDRGPSLLMGLARFGELARALPGDAHALIALALAELEVPGSEVEHYLEALLLDVNGWASLCAYLRWTARLAGRDDDTLVDLLAVRLAWEWMLHRDGGLAPAWSRAMADWPAIDRAARGAQQDDWILQRALELAYQGALCRSLAGGFDARPVAEPSALAVFCIDVRSERFRRALEARDPRVQTMGFAGFFGLPAEYRPLGSDASRPQLPGLLAPRVRIEDVSALAGLERRRAARLDLGAALRAFKTAAVSGFTYVESLGLLYGAKLLGDGFGLTRPTAAPERAGLSASEHALLKPRLASTVDGRALDADARADLAAGVLRGMGLVRDFAPLVALLGHGSATTNNPHAAGLDCGACCGQTGEVNARAVAALLNEPAVRAGVAARGIAVPEGTWFVAGLHDTTTDAVGLFDLDELPPSHNDAVASLRRALEAAGRDARRERAASLGLEPGDDEALAKQVRARARDWAQVRPEWGLANNAAIVFAPRERSRHIDLGGRAFLHDYRFERDEGFATLELLMTAPMVVAHWINLQYYASTVDNARWGSGNKVLHNVVGGHLGVFEGNGGDLRIGLPMQSLHDGARWVHTPLRLGVFVEAPRAAVDAVLAKHEKVRELVDHGWVHLFRIDAGERALSMRRDGAWVAADAAALGGEGHAPEVTP